MKTSQPMDSNRTEISQDPMVSHPKPAGPKILVVDDNEDLLLTLGWTLEKAGFRPLRASSGKRAVIMATEDAPDLILMDAKMPLQDGFETCAELKVREETKKIPIIMLTGAQQVNDVEKAYERGACDYVMKPFDNDRLIAKIKKALNA